ncbi:hypothetical protein [Thalassospira povalilytica]|uniref:hypothetical protein n=1 Tax=Thalassospira povalilytica TaxID=732237 RepID=UPI003AA9CB95
MSKKLFHPQMTYRRWGKIIGIVVTLDISAVLIVYGLLSMTTATIKDLSIPITILVFATLSSLFFCLVSVLHSHFYAFFSRRGIHSMTDKVRQTPLSLYLIKGVVENADRKGLDGRYQRHVTSSSASNSATP